MIHFSCLKAGAVRCRRKWGMIFLKEKNQALGEKLSLRETVSYGLGDLACSMVFNFMASYLL